MTANRAILIFCLVIGAGLGAFLHSLMTARESVVPGEAAQIASGLTEPTEATGFAGGQQTGAHQQNVDVGSGFHWSQLESTDFRIYVANLRAIGCPERTIRDIIRAEVDHFYEPRYRELEGEEERRHEFWKLRSGPGPANEYARHLSFRQLDREKEALMDRLLGSPGKEGRRGEPGELAVSANDTETFPPPREVMEQVEGIQEKYHHLQEQLRHDAMGEIYPDDALALQALEEQRLEELSAVLTPDQLREFELRDSSTADHLRHELVAFQPTEDEFRTLFEVRKNFETEFGEHEFEILDEEYRRNREAAEAEMNEQIKALLGEERFAEYELATDHRYRDLYRLSARFDVPEESVRQMYDLWRVSEQQVDRIHGNESLTHEQKMLLMATLREEMESQGREYLGDDAFFNYRARGGEWMVHMFE